MKGRSPFIRRVASRPSTSMLISNSSTGRGKAPSASTSLPISAITIIWSLAVATIFSCKSAPPPPLIRLRLESNSSAPSIVTSSQRASSRLITSMPTSRASSAVRVDVGTPLIRNPSSRTISPRQRTIQAAVLPVPSPTRIPSSTKSTERLAATNLALSMGDNSPVMAATPRVFRPGYRRVGAGVRGAIAPRRGRSDGHMPRPRAPFDGRRVQSVDIELVADFLPQPQFAVVERAVGGGHIAGNRIGGLIELRGQVVADQTEKRVKPVLDAEEIEHRLRHHPQPVEIIGGKDRQVVHRALDLDQFGGAHVLVRGGDGNHDRDETILRGQRVGDLVIHDGPFTPGFVAVQNIDCSPPPQ